MKPQSNTSKTAELLSDMVFKPQNSQIFIHPPASEASRELLNLTERKNQHTCICHPPAMFETFREKYGVKPNLT